MPFTLTLEHVRSILGPAESGDWQPFADAVDPNVIWWIVDDRPDEFTKAGVYVYPYLLTFETTKIDELDRIGHDGKKTSTFHYWSALKVEF